MDSIPLFDTHCHLDGQNCPGGALAAIDRARSAGVAYFTSIGVGGVGPMRDAVALAESRPNVWATVGVHPHEAASWDEEIERVLVELLAHPRVVALGEVGLDYHYDRSPRERQREVFARSIALAKKFRKPLVIHTRRAASETLELLESENAADVGGIVHCFSEDRAFASRALDLGFDLSFSGIVTFKSALSIQDVAAWAPSDRVLVETDSPYLSPVPLRGKPCEPAFLVHTARRVAELRGVAVSAVAHMTTLNAARRFAIDLEASSVSPRREADAPTATSS